MAGNPGAATQTFDVMVTIDSDTIPSNTIRQKILRVFNSWPMS
ncbi:hypothetical protein X882_5965 [Burkholderia pseudomallei MSHR4303]|nr:hypothetical protein X882_5965 [Burkholderia pseudomallei MSHR4303]KOT21292.1 hypothetical protein DM52_1003 [Burkholderia mallei]